MDDERVFQVFNPVGVPWAVRFKEENSAWSRIIALKQLPGGDNKRNRKSLKKIGWKVETVRGNDNL